MSKIYVEYFTPDEWRGYAESAHKLVFKTYRPEWVDRISFALLAHDGNDTVGYVTCRETDNESLYWQFGGALDEYRGIKAVRGFQAFLDWTGRRYRRCVTNVKNDNVNYLHLLMKMGFRCIGTRYFNKEIYLELTREFENAVQEQSAEALSLCEAPKDGEKVGAGDRGQGSSGEEKEIEFPMAQYG